MPLVRIEVREGKPATWREAIGEATHRALVEALNVPGTDRFQVITEHRPGDLVYDPSYLDIARTDDFVAIQVTLNAGRTVEMKKAFYARLAALLAEAPGLRPEDLLVSLVEVPKENWSFGNGVAQYAG
jgi:phenylpyruvate tautomerase PptA (4-oxalocrotonate tautomerase family)